MRAERKALAAERKALAEATRANKEALKHATEVNQTLRQKIREQQEQQEQQEYHQQADQQERRRAKAKRATPHGGALGGSLSYRVSPMASSRNGGLPMAPPVASNAPVASPLRVVLREFEQQPSTNSLDDRAMELGWMMTRPEIIREAITAMAIRDTKPDPRTDSPEQRPAIEKPQTDGVQPQANLLHSTVPGDGIEHLDSGLDLFDRPTAPLSSASPRRLQQPFAIPSYT